MRYKTNNKAQYQFKGVIETVSFENFIKILSNNKLETKFKFIDLEREKYISKFLGIDSKDAAENFIENIKTINDQK